MKKWFPVGGHIWFKHLESSKQKQRLMELELKATAGSAELVSTNVKSRLNSSWQYFCSHCSLNYLLKSTIRMGPPKNS